MPMRMPFVNSGAPPRPEGGDSSQVGHRDSQGPRPRRPLFRWLKRPPDFLIGGAVRPYIRRWWLIPRNRWFNIYVHQILRDDDDRALHDHPWLNVSIVLRGGYIEVLPDRRRLATPYLRIADMPVVRKYRGPGSIVFRRAISAHRLELPVHSGGITYCWSLFITGPRIREWYFHCAQGPILWKKFVASDDRGAVGKGCEQ